MSENKELQQQIAMLRIRNLMLDKEFLMCCANKDIHCYDSWQFDYNNSITMISAEIEKELSNLTVAQTPEVQPLKWVDNVASTIVGDFIVGANNGGWWYALQEYIRNDGVYIVHYDTIEKAKQAAEAHYREVILGCLK